MTKQLITTICILGLVGMVVGVVANADATDTVSATVTPKLLTVSVSDRGVAYGTLDLGSTKNTALYHESTNPNGMTPADTQTATDGSNVDVGLNIMSSDAVSGITWELAASAGSNAFVHKFSTDGGANWIQLPVNHDYATLVTSPAASSVDFDLQITTPTITTDHVQKTITVTVQVTG